MEKNFINISLIEDSPEYENADIHRHDRYEIIWFTDVVGNDSMLIDFIEYPIFKDCFYLIVAGQLHSLDKRGKKGWVFSLSKSFYYAVSPIEMQNRSLFAINSIYNQQKCNMCETMTQLILKEYNEDRRYLLLESYLKALFIHLTPFFEKSQKANLEYSDFNRISDFLDLIEKNYIQHRDVEYYATELSLTSKGLNDFSRKMTGKTVKQHIQERLILEMKREICFGHTSFKDISYQLGFSEPSYFSRFFKSQTGETPDEFRNSFLLNELVVNN